MRLRGRVPGRRCLSSSLFVGSKRLTCRIRACIDLDLPTAQKTCTAIQQSLPHSSKILPYPCDVTSEPDVGSAFSSIVSDFGSIDVLVTAAGIVDNVAAEEYGYERWKKMLDVNLNGTFLCAREAGRSMLERGKGGSVVLVGSMSGMICVRPQKQAAYNAVSWISAHVGFPFFRGVLWAFFIAWGNTGRLQERRPNHKRTA